MKVFFDERCLTHPELLTLLRAWRQIVDFAATNAKGLLLFLDRDAARSGSFLQRLNSLKPDDRVLFVPMLYGAESIIDWRPISIAFDTMCQLATEEEPVLDCAICEVYEHHKIHATAALFGHEHSSFANCLSVGVTKLDPPETLVDVPCGTTLTDFQRIGTAWNCLLVHYDFGLNRSPRDNETALGHAPQRFTRVGRIERNGRRQVYRETTTDRFFYVDNLHYGAAAHLEVFDSHEIHLGTADLDGNLDVSALVPGRTISW